MTIIGVSLLSVLITLTGLEVSAKQEMSFERELKDAGLAEYCLGPAGRSDHLPIRVEFDDELQDGRTISSCTDPDRVGCPGVSLFRLGRRAIQYLPIAVLSGLVLYVGLDFVQTWLFESRSE